MYSSKMVVLFKDLNVNDKVAGKIDPSSCMREISVVIFVVLQKRKNRYNLLKVFGSSSDGGFVFYTCRSFIWEGISSFLWSEICFTATCEWSHKT